jgi:hypothetical protein
MTKYKVVVNGCYGGFGVSERGAEWLLANGANPDKVTINRAGYEGGYVYVYVSLERHDPLLVRMVITLGSDAASGKHAQLYVHELVQPLYRIDEYDGSESVEEPHHVRWDDASTQESA